MKLFKKRRKCTPRHLVQVCMYECEHVCMHVYCESEPLLDWHMPIFTSKCSHYTGKK